LGSSIGAACGEGLMVDGFTVAGCMQKRQEAREKFKGLLYYFFVF
jgi:hypothetical protein